MRNLPVGSRLASALVLAGVLALPGDASGQESAQSGNAEAEEQQAAPVHRAPQPGDETRVFVLDHATPRVLADVLEVFPATITYSNFGSPSPSALAVSASPAVLAAIAETISRLDQPPRATRSVELTGYILEALTDSTTSQLPPAVESVVAQLRQTLRYQGYRVVDSLVARTREGTGLTLQGASPAPASYGSLSYTLAVNRTHLVDDPDGSTRVRLSDLELDVRTTHEKRGQQRSRVQASVEIDEGQQVVVGKAGLGDSGSALILVLSAQVSE